MPQDDLKRFFISIALPSSERNIMTGKQEMISELTRPVCSLPSQTELLTLRHHLQKIAGLQTRLSTEFSNPE